MSSNRDEYFEGFDKKGLCKLCKQPRTPKGHDPCIADLPGVLYACCGHGGENGYIKFEDGRVLTFTPIEIELDKPKHLWVHKPIPMHIGGDTYTVLSFKTRRKRKAKPEYMPVERNGWKLLRNANERKEGPNES